MSVDLGDNAEDSLIAPWQSREVLSAMVDWSDLIQRIKSGELGARSELFELMGRAIKFLIVRQLGSDNIEDRLQQTFAHVVDAIQASNDLDSRHLFRFVRTVVLRQISACQQESSRSSPVSAPNPVQPQFSMENEPLVPDRESLVWRIWGQLSSRDRQIFTRYYLLEQTPAEICEALGISETAFRLLGHRLKLRFKELVRQSTITRTELNSPALHDVLPILAHAVGVFGDEHKAWHWLITPSSLLNNQAPEQALETESGRQQVEQILTRIEHNIPS